MRAVMEDHAFRLHLGDPAIDVLLFHLEVWNAVTQQAAGLGVLLEHVNVVAGTRKLLRAGEPGRARADDRDRLAGPDRGRFRLHPALLEGAIHDGAFDRLDGHRIVVEVERAGGFAGRRAYASGEFRKIVGGVQILRGLLPVPAIDEVVPVGDLVVHRATGVAIGHAAIHAARGLRPVLLLGKRQDEFAPVLDALLDRLIMAVVALEIEETRNLSHSYSAACIVRAFSISASARRYSTGITLRNIGQYLLHSDRIVAARTEPARRAWRVISKCSRCASNRVMSVRISTRPWDSRSWMW